MSEEAEETDDDSPPEGEKKKSKFDIKSSVGNIKAGIDKKAFRNGMFGVMALLILLLVAGHFKYESYIAHRNAQLAGEIVKVSQSNFAYRVKTPITKKNTDAHHSTENEKTSSHEKNEHSAEEHDITPASASSSLDKNSLFYKNRRPFKHTGAPIIAIALKDFGLSTSLSQEALETLPQDVSFLLSVYASGQTDTLQESGHEIWLDLPVESAGFPENDPGSFALLSRASLKKNIDRVNVLLSSYPHYVGVALPSDNSFEDNPTVFEDMMSAIMERGYGVYGLNTSGKGVMHLKKIAHDNKSPFFNNTVDFENSTLKMLERQATERGYALADIPLTPKTLENLQSWIPTLESKGIKLAPISAVYTHPAKI